MTPEQARALFLEHCQPGDRSTLERYGEKAAVAAILAAIEAREAPLLKAHKVMRDGYADAVSGLRYILQEHGRLSGVGFDRVFDHHDEWVKIPEREGLLAGSHTVAGGRA